MPKVSVGMPVYNGEKTIKKAIESIIKQDFTDLELIISDNASTDNTRIICLEYCKQDSRIHYFRQEKNIGPVANFKYVLDMANSEYFFWAAADDYRSLNFISENLKFLEKHKDYVASASPNCFEREEGKKEYNINFSLEGPLYNRLREFLLNSGRSHGIFYALMRTDKLKKCSFVGINCIAADWIIITEMLVQGPIKRVQKGLFVSGRVGVSNSRDPFKLFRNKSIEHVMPLYEFSKKFVIITLRSRGIALLKKVKLLFELQRLNNSLMFSRIKKIFRIVYIILRYIKRLFIKSKNVV